MAYPQLNLSLIDPEWLGAQSDAGGDAWLQGVQATEARLNAEGGTYIQANGLPKGFDPNTGRPFGTGPLTGAGPQGSQGYFPASVNEQYADRRPTGIGRGAALVAFKEQNPDLGDDEAIAAYDKLTAREQNALTLTRGNILAYNANEEFIRKRKADTLGRSLMNVAKLGAYSLPFANLASGGATAALGTVGGSGATSLSQVPGVLFDAARAYGGSFGDTFGATFQPPSSDMLGGGAGAGTTAGVGGTGAGIGAGTTAVNAGTTAAGAGGSGIASTGLTSGAPSLTTAGAATGVGGAGGAGIASTGLTSGAPALSSTGAAVGAGGAGVGFLSTATNFLSKAAPIVNAATNIGLAGASIYGAVQGASAAKKAANAQVQGIESSNQLLRDIYEQNRTDLAPFREAGVGALGRLEDITEGDFSSFETSPGYQFRQEEGQKAQERGAASRGMLLSGRQIKERERFAQGTASEEFGNYWNRQAGLAGVGQSATSQGIQAAGQYGTAASGNLASAGTARASGYVGQSNAISDSITQALYARAFA